MGWLIIGVLIIYGWVEFEALFIVGDMIGGLASFLGIFVTAIIGLSLLRNQGNAVMHRMRTQMAQGQTGISQMADSLSLVLGAILMLLPGYVTDFLGVICFIPGIRNIIGTILMKHMAGRIITATAAASYRGFGAGGFGAGGFSSDSISSMKFQYRNTHKSNGTASNVENQHQTDSRNDELIEGEFSEKPTPNPEHLDAEHFDKDK